MSSARWGIGALEVNRSDEAMPGELMVDSNTGIFAVKSYSGTRGNTNNVYSYDYNTRLKNTINGFKQHLNSMNHISDVVKIDISDNIGPFVMTNEESYGLNSIKISTGMKNFVHVNFDIDLVNKETGIISNSILTSSGESSISVNFSVIFAYDRVQNSEYFLSYLDTPIDIANARTIKPNYESFLNATNCTYDLKMGYLMVKLPANIANTHLIVLNSILFAYC